MVIIHVALDFSTRFCTHAAVLKQDLLRTLILLRKSYNLILTLLALNVELEILKCVNQVVNVFYDKGLYRTIRLR